MGSNSTLRVIAVAYSSTVSCWVPIRTSGLSLRSMESMGISSIVSEYRGGCWSADLRLLDCRFGRLVRDRELFCWPPSGSAEGDAEPVGAAACSCRGATCAPELSRGLARRSRGGG